MMSETKLSLDMDSLVIGGPDLSRSHARLRPNSAEVWFRLAIQRRFCDTSNVTHHRGVLYGDRNTWRKPGGRGDHTVPELWGNPPGARLQAHLPQVPLLLLLLGPRANAPASARARQRVKTRRRVARVTITVIQMQCESCGNWFTPKRQPPNSNLKTCSGRCRTALYRRAKIDP